MGLYETLNAAGLGALRLAVEWTDQTDYLGAPTASSSGVFLRGAPAALVLVALREVVHARTSRVEIGVADLTTTVYTVTVNGNAVNYDASVELPADATALIQGIADAINADGTVGPLVLAVPDPLAPTTTVKLTGKAEADYSINASVAGGTGTIASITADPVSAIVRFFDTPSGTIAASSSGYEDGWTQPADGEWNIGYRGLSEAILCGGSARGYLGLYNVAKHGSDGASVTVAPYRVMIGPDVTVANL